MKKLHTPKPWRFLLMWRHSTRHPVQSALLILGVALGVAMMVAVDLANGSARRAFALSTDSLVGKATHQIIAVSGDLPSELYTSLRRDLGVRTIAPTVTGLVLLQEGEALPLQLLGVDPFAEAPFRNYLGGASNQLSQAVLNALLAQPNTVLLTTNLAQRYNLQIGDTITLDTGDAIKPVTLVGLLNPADGVSSQALDGLVLADISTAQEVLDKTGQLSTIDLIVNDDDELTAIANDLPTNVDIQPAARRNQTLQQMTAAFELNLAALSLLALTVGMFLIYNTISFSVVQRRPVLGTLRCLGVTRRQIFGLVLLEAFLLSAVGAVLGLGLGVVLGRGLVTLVSQSINDLFFTVTVQSVSMPLITLYKGFLAGIAAGLLAAFVPALEATSIAPVTALKRSTAESRITHLLPWLAIAGVVMMLCGWLALTLVNGALWFSFAALFAILLGSALLAPLLTQQLMHWVQPVTRSLFGIIGIMAPRDIVRALSRTSVSVAALMLAVSVIIGVSIMIDSFRGTVVLWLDSILTADIYISPAGQSLRLDGGIDPNFVAEMQTNPDVLIVSRLLQGDVMDTMGNPIEIRAFDPQPKDSERPMLWVADDNVGQAFAALDDDAIMVSEVLARRFELPLNNPGALTLITETGPRMFPIKGIFYDYAAPELGYVLMRANTYARNWPSDLEVSNLGLYLKPTALPQVNSLTQQLTDRYGAQYRLTFSANRSVKDNALAIFERTFTITAALRLQATVVAFIGVLSTVMALQLERTRELGTLRANGMSRRQLWGKTILETVLLGLTAGVIALPVGWLLAYILIYFINLRSFGWSLAMQTNPQIFVMSLVVALTAALLAGIYPLLRLNRLEIATAIRQS